MTPVLDDVKHVFINCPYDSGYWNFLDAICFTIQICGFTPRCAMEFTDSSRARMDNIFSLIDACSLAVHDLSRVELSPENSLPRFNMPFELGLFLGAARFGDVKHKRKTCVILESDEHRYKAFLSDMSGYDIQFHKGEIAHVVACIRRYLRGASEVSGLNVIMPGPAEIILRYAQYRQALPNIARYFSETDGAIHFLDRRHIIYEWLQDAQLQEGATSAAPESGG